MVQPFDGGKFDKRFDDVFSPAVKAAGFEPYRVDRDHSVSVPIVDIERGIREASAVLVDVTVDNPNVWFELGFAIATGKDLCIVCSKERSGPFPFDIQHRKIITYSPDAPRDFKVLENAITERLSAIESQQSKREDIQSITAEPVKAGLTDYEAAGLACAASAAGGIDDTVSNWLLRGEMEKAGFNRLACNVSVRGLRSKGLISVETAEGEDGPYEVYKVSDRGWEWIAQNAHSLNLRTKPKGKSIKGFSGAFDEEIPF
jgi:hypothetical protein